jgi:hypothetical protein
VDDIPAVFVAVASVVLLGVILIADTPACSPLRTGVDPYWSDRRNRRGRVDL